MRPLQLLLPILLAFTIPQAFAQGALQVLHTFLENEGGPPSGPLTELKPGTFVGVTHGQIEENGQSVRPSGLYVVTSGGQFRTLTTFNPLINGQSAYGPLLAASDGYLYGVSVGSANAPATVFRSDRQGNLSTVLSGQAIFSPLVEGSDVKLYAMRSIARTQSQFVRITPPSSYTPLGALSMTNTRLVDPLVSVGDGNYYVAARDNSLNGGIFRFTSMGMLNPVVGIQGLNGGLMQSLGGALFGSATDAQQTSFIFRVGTDGVPSGVHAFPTYELPSTLIQASDGKLYGIAVGEGSASIIYSMAPNGSNYQVISNFEQGLLTGIRVSPLVQGSDGRLYGVLVSNTAAPFGQVFSVNLGLPRPQPTITRVYPSQGAVGATVAIRGSYLLEPQSVKFNGTSATQFRGVSGAHIYVVVPAGATTGPVTVTNANGTATSTTDFIVTAGLDLAPME